MSDKRQTTDSAPIEASRDDGPARARLLEVATKLFAEQGLAGTSTRDIAKAADLNISLISYYFGGKEGLYRAVIEEFATRMYSEVQQFMAQWDLENLTKDSFQKTMRVLVDRMIPMKYENQNIHTLLQREVMAGLPHSKEIYENIMNQVLEKIIDLYKAAQKKGIVRADVNPYILFFSMAHATDMYLHMSGCGSHLKGKIIQLPEGLKDYSDQIYKIFVEGVLT